MLCWINLDHSVSYKKVKQVVVDLYQCQFLYHLDSLREIDLDSQIHADDQDLHQLEAVLGKHLVVMMTDVIKSHLEREILEAVPDLESTVRVLLLHGVHPLVQEDVIVEADQWDLVHLVLVQKEVGLREAEVVPDLVLALGHFPETGMSNIFKLEVNLSAFLFLKIFF